MAGVRFVVAPMLPNVAGVFTRTLPTGFLSAKSRTTFSALEWITSVCPCFKVKSNSMHFSQAVIQFSSIKYAITSITSFTSAPMQIVTVLGVITFVIALIFGINTLVNKFTGRSAEGFPTVILLQLITSAIIMFSLGIIGYYLAKIYEEIKQRPRYIISEKLNFDNDRKEKENRENSRDIRPSEKEG